MEELKQEKRYKNLLILIVIFGFVFRYINVDTRILVGDPPHFCLEAINFFHSGLLIIWDQSAYLWYAFTNIFYNFFGITQFASRFSSLLFGTLSILAIYIFVLEFSNGNKKLALISAIIYAFAPGFIWQTADEHDISALFFIILAFYSLIYGLKHESKWHMFISGILFGISAMWKAYVAILLIPYLGFILYYHRTKRFDVKKNYKLIILILLIIFILVSPAFIYNYLNYKHNNVVDFIFATFLKIKNEKILSLYGWTMGQEIYKGGGIIQTFYRLFINENLEGPGEPIIFRGIESFYSNGHILAILLVISFIFIFLKRKQDTFAKDYLIFFSLYFFIPFIVIINGNYLNKHLIQFSAFSIPLISYLIMSCYDYLSYRFDIIKRLGANKYSLYVLYVMVLLFVFFVILSNVTPEHQAIFSANPEGKLISYKLSNIPENSLIIYDDRIYNSAAGWFFNDRFYIPVSFLSDFMSYNMNSSNRQIVPVFIVECVIDDCGWGTIKDNPQLNNSMEKFFENINNQSIPIVFTIKSKISGVSYYNPLISKNIEMQDKFKIYKLDMPIDLGLAKQVKMQYEYFLYPTGYLNKNSKTFQNFIYTPSGFLEESINSFAWFIFYLNIVLSFLAILYLLFEVYLHL